MDPVIDLEAFAQKFFDSQPFTQFIGATLVAVSSDSASIRLDIADHHKQQHAFAHGGGISYLADNAITFAGGLALGGDALTSEFKINYLRPATGQALIACATAKGVGKRQAVCQCEIFTDGQGGSTLCALAQGTVIAAKA